MKNAIKLENVTKKYKVTPHISQFQNRDIKKPLQKSKGTEQSSIISHKAHLIRPTEIFCQP
ncbi:MAG: hypothetical protein J6A93_06335, partial [Ruminococcus sp.]|nr:hypothetical protein [Ruminococcus sp.]